MSNRFLTLVLTGVLAISLSACGDEGKSKPAEQSETSNGKSTSKKTKELTPAQKRAATKKEVWRLRRYRYSVTEVAGNHVRVVPNKKKDEYAKTVNLSTIIYSCHAIGMDYESHIYVARSFGEYYEDDWADVTCKEDASKETKTDKPAATTSEKAR